MVRLLKKIITSPMVHGIINILLVMFLLNVLIKFCGGVGSAVLLCTLIIIVYWIRPTRGTSSRVEFDPEYFEGKKVNSNPFYNTGRMRKHRKNSIMSDIKGIFWCQMQGVVQIFALIFYGVFSAANLGKHYWTVELFFGLWITVGIVIYFAVEFYYDRFVKNIMTPSRFSKYEWKPFTYIGIKRIMATELYNKCENREILQEGFSDACEKMGYVLQRKYSLKDRDDVSFWVRREKNVHIFGMIFLPVLEEENREGLDVIFQNFLNEYIGKKTLSDTIYFTYLLCVKEESKTFRRLINTFVGQGWGRYLLPVGVIEGEECFEISTQLYGTGIRHYRNMRDEFCKMSRIAGEITQRRK